MPPNNILEGKKYQGYNPNELAPYIPFYIEFQSGFEFQDTTYFS